MKKQFLVFSIFLLTTISLSAQSDMKCGSSPFRMAPGQAKLKNIAAPESDTATLYIPVTANIVGNDNGTGYYTVSQTLDALCRLQNDFEEHGFHFYLQNINYINSSAFYNMSASYVWSDAMYQFIEDHNTPNTMNIYIVQEAGGYSFLTYDEVDGADYSVYPPIGIFAKDESLVLDKDHLNTADHLFTHEVGHFFGLYHTFQGENWGEFMANGVVPDTTYYSIYDPVNDTTLNLFWLVERVDGSNCDIAGDCICDTPPDYLGGNGFQCNANGESNTVQTDPVGATFRSDGTLYMSYSNDACQERFSPQQVNVMRFLTEGQRSYLLFNQTPPPPFPPANWGLFYPPNNDTLILTDSVTLQWDIIPEADFYVLEFWRKINNNFQIPLLKTAPLQGNTFKVAVNPGLNYSWNVAAVNKYYPCDVLRDTAYFSVSTSVNTEEATLAQISLQMFPNPASDRLHWRLPESAANPQHMTVGLFDAQGRLLRFQLPAIGQTLDLQSLSPGMYLLKVVSGGRVFSGKIVKQ